MSGFFDWIMNFFYNLASAALALLPNDPIQTDKIQSALSSFSDLMAEINYFVPFGDMLVMASVYTGAVAVWYGVRWVLRFAKYIE